ncbi:unnamed protein product, partial [marine sediment metagenome]
VLLSISVIAESRSNCEYLLVSHQFDRKHHGSRAHIYRNVEEEESIFETEGFAIHYGSDIGFYQPQTSI